MKTATWLAAELARLDAFLRPQTTIAPRPRPSDEMRRICRDYHLLPVERDILVLALAPEIDHAYAAVYGALSDDPHRRAPTRDLVLRLFASTLEDRLHLLALLQPSSVLFREGLLEGTNGDHRLASEFRIALPIAGYLLGTGASLRPPCNPNGRDLGWDSLILPPATRNALREFASAASCRRLVFDEWQLAPRLVSNHGLSALFAGASGTGKTLAASVIARDLDSTLLRIDLSQIVSKYIGETEKNLDRAFQSARDSGAILFFDEADALFGKRSEVKDAHDRYANLEISYLLQRMEEHDGITLLATNLPRNLDDAFLRRLHFVIEFPQPDEELRRRLWALMLAGRLPTAPDVDLQFLSRQFRLTGGEIRNAVLSAAFAAAADGRVVTMDLLVRGVARQVAKQGRAASNAEFKQFYERVVSAPQA